VAHVIGIDLGTVNSCVAVLEDGTAKVIADEAGNKTTPSIYAVSAKGDPICGYPAKDQMEQNRLNTIFAVKRLIGLKYDSEEVRAAREKMPYAIIPARNGDAWVEIDGQPTSPEEVSAQVLMRMKEVAEFYLKEKVARAVITVPAHFNDSQRQATKDAARIAGLDVLRVINEPTAAALAYGLTNAEATKNLKRKTVGKRGIQADKIVTVFDLGGGTFDVSVLALKDGVFDVLSTHGDTFLGGEDFDLAILNFLLAEFKRRTGVDLSKDKSMLQKLKIAARDAKHALSKDSKHRVYIPYVTPNHNLDIELDRKMMEKAVEHLLERLRIPCNHALEDAGLRAEDVDEAVLVGGMTKMPAVKKLCRLIFAKEPNESVDPDEAVALGAAIQAGVLQGLLKGVSLLDVTSLSLGIEIQGGMTHVMIPRSSKVPAKASSIFTTSAPNQPQISVHIVQGENNFAPENKTLGRFELTGIAPAPRGVPKIQVTIEVDADGIVHVFAKDLDTGEEKKIEIVASSGLSDTEIDSLLRENFTAQSQTERLESNTRVSNDGATLDDPLEQAKHALKSEVFMNQYRLDKEAGMLPRNLKKTIEEIIVLARQRLESRNIEELQNTTTALKLINNLFESRFGH
jgi:molecular chaperone DnaK